MLSRDLRSSLAVAQLVALLTLLRSVAYDRWITVLASVLLLTGAFAAQRGRTWGVALALASAAAFPVAWLIGIAPFWFCIVGAVGAMPFLHALPGMVAFDRRATALLTGIALSLGAAGALVWKQYAYWLFVNVPILRPSVHASHGLALGAIAASTAAVAVLLRDKTNARVARVRVSAGIDESVPGTETGHAATSGVRLADQTGADEPLEADGDTFAAAHPEPARRARRG